MNRFPIPALIFGTAATIALVQVTVASTPEIDQIIQAVTVRIDGQRRGGSGVIASRQGDIYYVLTNTHVVNAPENYTIVTVDGSRYPVEATDILSMPGVDLAVLAFKSPSEYRVAELGNSDLVQAGDAVYVAGWPRSGGSLRRRIFVNTEGEITQGGDALSYTNLVRAGMSGGPILNDRAQLIGINRIVRLEQDSDEIVASGVAINLFLNWWKTVELPIPRGEVTERSPLPQDITPSEPVALNTGDNFALANTLRTENGSISTVAIASQSQQGQLVASGNSDGTISVWNLSTGELITTLEGHEKAVNAVVISRDGELLASGSDDSTVKIWNLNNFELVRTLEGHQETVSSLAIAPNGKTLVSGSWDKTIKIWNPTTGELLQTLSDHSALISALTVSPNGKLLASGSQDRTIKLWNLNTGELFGTLRGHSLSVLAIAISPDGKTLASGSGDGTIGLWNLLTGEKVVTLKGHADGVWSLAIAPDGGTLMSGSWDRTIKLWNLATARLSSTLEGHVAYVNSIALSQDGTTLVSGDLNSYVHIWRKPR